jgi:hypothetical protein
VTRPISEDGTNGDSAHRESPVALFLVTTGHSPYANVHGASSRSCPVRASLCDDLSRARQFPRIAEFSNPSASPFCTLRASGIGRLVGRHGARQPPRDDRGKTSSSDRILPLRRRIIAQCRLASGRAARFALHRDASRHSAFNPVGNM